MLLSGLSVKKSTKCSSLKECTRSNPKKYHVTTKVIVKNSGYALSKLAVILPYPKTNEYQNISNYKLNGGEILSSGNDQYVRFTLTEHAPVPGETRTFTVEYDAVTYDVSSPILKEPVPQVVPLKNSYSLSGYLGKSGDQVDLKNPVIISNAERIWKETKGNLFQYAKKCYQYVAGSYKYCNPNTGLYPLHSLMSNGGGDCGNLSSIFISLLRYKDIPARHLIGTVAEAGFHVWSDFYLENYGWIPVDVTFKNGDPAHDYFGQLQSDHRIIFNRNINQVYIKEPGDSYESTLLQDYHWWFWGEGDSHKITSDYTISITPV
jgi:transglutaminase-like putative cysteine protease